MRSGQGWSQWSWAVAIAVMLAKTVAATYIEAVLD